MSIAKYLIVAALGTHLGILSAYAIFETGQWYIGLPGLYIAWKSLAWDVNA